MAREEVLAAVPGTFYRRPDPDADMFVEEGGEVAVGQTIAVVEVMKNFYEVEAEVEGTLVEFLVENEDVVEGGQPLAVIET
jgi:acetyl-CoA carboxylase biotin carboxyl carrier protein